LGTLLFAFCFSALAQQPKKIFRIGFLVVRSLESQAARVEAFRQGLRDLGYVEGQNILIDWRSADENESSDRVLELATDLVRSKVDIIVTGGALATAPAKKATSTIPIVMAQDNDPVGDGFVASLARPGGNITGLTNISPALSGKRLELLKEIIPKLLHVAVMGNSKIPGNAQAVKETQDAAQALKLKLQYFEIRSGNDIEGAFKAAAKERAQGVIVLQNLIANTHRKLVAEMAAKNRLPAILPFTEFVDAGGLISYGPNYPDLFRRAAIYVDKILKGAKPADLPVEQPAKFELIINLKAAKQIGLKIPPNVLARADRVIK
jgi:putative ABC transport system substrate-binding protein